MSLVATSLTCSHGGPPQLNCALSKIPSPFPYFESTGQQVRSSNMGWRGKDLLPTPALIPLPPLGHLFPQPQRCCERLCRRKRSDSPQQACFHLRLTQIFPLSGSLRTWSRRLKLGLPTLPPMQNTYPLDGGTGCAGFSVHQCNSVFLWPSLHEPGQPSEKVDERYVQHQSKPNCLAPFASSGALAKSKKALPDQPSEAIHQRNTKQTRAAFLTNTS